MNASIFQHCTDLKDCKFYILHCAPGQVFFLQAEAMWWLQDIYIIKPPLFCNGMALFALMRSHAIRALGLRSRAGYTFV